MVVALAWLAAAVLGAGSFLSEWALGFLLDCVFDSMSGFATTGLTFGSGPDHIARSVNLWRHSIMFIGGQGIVVVALSFLVRGSAGAQDVCGVRPATEKVLPRMWWKLPALSG